MKIRHLLAAAATSVGVLAIGFAAPATADDGPTFPEPDERCMVPPALFQVAAIVDPDSLEGCGFYEDPNYFENRKEAGLYNPNGVFSIIFG